jgi:hypothetical protein
MRKNRRNTASRDELKIEDLDRVVGGVNALSSPAVIIALKDFLTILGSTGINYLDTHGDAGPRDHSGP